MTLYSIIYETFLSKIEDYFLANEIEERPSFVEREMKAWLKATVVKTKKMVNTTITFDDENSAFVEELDDLEVEVFSLGMVYEWLRPRLYSTLNVSQFIGGKEEKFYSQANHITVLQSLYKDARLEKIKIVRGYGYEHNSYLTGE